MGQVGGRNHSTRSRPTEIFTQPPVGYGRGCGRLSLLAARTLGELGQQTSASHEEGGCCTVPGPVVKPVKRLLALWVKVQGTCKVPEKLCLVLRVLGVSVEASMSPVGAPGPCHRRHPRPELAARQLQKAAAVCPAAAATRAPEQGSNGGAAAVRQQKHQQR